MVDESTVEVTEAYDPEHDLIDAAIRCEMIGGWRTDFLAPGLGSLAGERWEDSFCWRAVQWHWVDGDVDAPGAAYDEDSGADSAPGWRLRGRQELGVDEVAQWMPPVVVPWLERMTQRCLDELEHAELELPDAAAVRRRLAAGLARLRSRQSRRRLTMIDAPKPVAASIRLPSRRCRALDGSAPG